MATVPIESSVRTGLRLAAFAPKDAALVASWVRDAREAYWLAPRTPPPLTPEKVLEWQSPAGQALLLVEPPQDLAVAYGEVNPLGGRAGEFWLGHLLVAPDRRGQGLGRVLTRLLLQRAFERLGARRVTLVVFPENHGAIACYRAAGMHFDGYENHYFPARGELVQMVRMARETPV